MIKLHVRVGVFVLCVACCAGRAPAQGVLVWSDEFTQPDGSAPNPAKWAFDIGTGSGGWGNNELQYYTSRPTNVFVSGGMLHIVARKENYMGSAYTSAKVKTAGLFSRTYGRFEFSAKLPTGQGYWPALWMMPQGSAYGGWAASGEIDVMENRGNDPTTVLGTIHYGGEWPANNYSQGPSHHFTGGDSVTNFHLYSLEWTNSSFRWYVDNQLFETQTSWWSSGGPYPAPFNQPFYLIMNLAVGGNFGGNPTNAAIFPGEMLVDYVRVYAVTNSDPPITNTPTCGNALPNPGFEIGGLADWVRYGPNTYSVSSNTLPVHSGSNAFKVYGQFNGSENYSGVYRDTVTAPGTTYTAGGWAYTPGNDKIAGANSAWLEVSFRDSGDNILSLYRSTTITASSTAGVWLSLAITNQFDPATSALTGSVSNFVAPAGTTSARYQIVFRQPANANGAVLFDDLNLIPAVAPTPVAATASLNGGNLNISFPTLPGEAYEVRYKNDLSDSVWQVFTNVTGDGGTKAVADALSASRRFYTVVRPCN